MFFTAVNPMDDQSMEEVQYDLDKTKDRTIQKYLETSFKHSVWMQFKARSEEWITVLSNTITLTRSLQHTACDLY